MQDKNDLSAAATAGFSAHSTTGSGGWREMGEGGKQC